MSIHDSPLLSALHQRPPSRKPVWFMRQAGRYLPEYRKIREKHSMLDAIRTPALASEITLQPLKRFDLDAGIIFADILNPLIGMGINLDFVEGEGPRIFNPIQEEKDVAKLIVPTAAESVSYTLEAIEIVSAELARQSKPLLGFCGAPFTMASYLIEGRGSHTLTKTKQFMYRTPHGWNMLLGKLVVFLADYLAAQVAAGAAAVQVFESWAQFLSPYQYHRFVLPHTKELVRLTREKTNAPIVFFSTGSYGILPLVKDLNINGFSVDWRIPLSRYSSLLGSDVPLQGNLDPELMAGPQSELMLEVERILEDACMIPFHVFNLGHGILPHTPPENVAAVVEWVHGVATK